MQANSHAQEHTHKQKRPTAQSEETNATENQRNVIEPVQEHVHRILHQVGRVALQYSIFVLLCCATQDPTHMCPPATVARRMRISGFIGVRMMNAMSHHPVNRSA